MRSSGESFDLAHLGHTNNGQPIFQVRLVCFGYVLGFDGLVYTGSDSDLCFRPLEPARTSPMYIIWKKYQAFSPVASLLLDELQKAFG